MALFKKSAAKPASTRETESTRGGKEKATKVAAAPAASGTGSSATYLATVLKQARITEKASDMYGKNVYVFDITEKATKRDISRAMQSLFKVTPRKINVVTVRRKAVRNARTGKAGMKGGGRKAYVFLKQGDSVTL